MYIQLFTKDLNIKLQGHAGRTGRQIPICDVSRHKVTLVNGEGLATNYVSRMIWTKEHRLVG
jgi:hypothetical protein